MDRKRKVERRKNRRFHLQNIAFAVLRDDVSKVGQIMDISMSGLSFHYIMAGGNADRSCELDILLAYHGMCTEKIQFETVSDIEIENKSPFSPMLMRRCGVRFGELTDNQKSQLKDFIFDHTTDNWNQNRWKETVESAPSVNGLA